MEEKIINIDEPKTLANLMNIKFPKSRWIVEDLIPCEGITLLSAAPASFKTWLALDIAINVAKGSDFLDKYSTQKSNVLIIDEESGERMLQERFKSLGAPLDLPIYYFSRQGFKMNDFNDVDKLISTCEEYDIKLAIFDSLVRIHSGDENSSRDMSKLLNLFKQLSDKGVSCLILHHNVKNNGMNSYSPANSMRGSGDILAAADVHMALSQSGERVTIQQTKNRFMREISAFKVKLVENEDSTNQFEFVGAAQSKDSVDKLRKEAILSQINETPGLNLTQLRDNLAVNGEDIPQKKFRELVDELEHDDKMIHARPGARNAINYFAGFDDSLDRSVSK